MLVFKLLEWMGEKRRENTKKKKRSPKKMTRGPHEKVSTCVQTEEMEKSINSSNYTGVFSSDHLAKIIAMSSVLPEC